jgi:hypothetical protein
MPLRGIASGLWEMDAMAVRVVVGDEWEML